MEAGAQMAGGERRSGRSRWEAIFEKTFCCAAYSIYFAGMLLPSLLSAGAQTPAQSSTGPSQAVQIPLSARQQSQGSASITERSTSAGGGNAVDTIDSSVTVSNAFAGAVPNGEITGAAIQLTLDSVLSRGLRFNLAAIDETAAVKQAQGQREIARSSLLPNVNTAISEEFERLNLREMGVESSTFPETAKFNYYDARAARLRQSVVDLVKVENLHAASHDLQASIKSTRNTRDLVVLAVSGSYLQVIAASARVVAATAQVETSQKIYQQAEDRFMAGLNARIDAMRAQVQLQVEQQRLRSLTADLETQKLRLARIIGLPIGQKFVTADEFSFSPISDLTEETALQKALGSRADLAAAVDAVKAAERAVKAARDERLPNLSVIADFGAGGITPSHESTGVYSVSGTLTIPIYEGGRIHGDIQVAAAALRQRQAELEDTRAQVAQDVRQAFIDLNSAEDQGRVAESNVTLAHDTLTQSEDRFAAGVADSVELVQAEQTVVQADEDLIAATFDHNLAKVSLARAMGNAEQNLSQLLRK
jgi:outer membrane protein TolC